MGYLIKNDYRTYIQGPHLAQLVQGDDSKRVEEEAVSVQTIVQRLAQKYNLNVEFTETLPYDDTKTYGAGERAVIDVDSNGFKMWAANAHYKPGALVINGEIGYRCKVDNTDATFRAVNWVEVGNRYTIYHGAYPSICTLGGQPNPATLVDPFAPLFNYKAVYSKGDVVFWKGYTYVCNQASTSITHTEALQYVEYSNLPYSNVFPDDPVGNNNGVYWKDKTAYTIPSGVLSALDYDNDRSYVKGDLVYYLSTLYKCIEDTPNPAGDFDSRYWENVVYLVRADNRNQTIKYAMVCITVFKLSPLIAPMNAPKTWLEDYREILRELNRASAGEISMTLPLNQPRKGTRTFFTSEIKKDNNY